MPTPHLHFSISFVLLSAAFTPPVFAQDPPPNRTPPTIDPDSMDRFAGDDNKQGGKLSTKNVDLRSAPPPSPQVVETRRLIEDASYPAAQVKAEEIKAQQPTNPEGFRLAAMAMAGQGNVDGARRELQAGLKVAPQDPGLIALQKLLPQEVGKRIDKTALQAQLKALAGGTADDTVLAPNAPVLASPVAFGLAEAAWRSGAPPPARAVAGQPTPKLDVSREGVLRLKLGDPGTAVKYLDAKIQEDPKNWFAYRLRALAKHKLKDLEGARRDASQAIGLNPRDLWSYLARSIVEIDLGLHAEAEADARKAVSLNPQEAHAWRTKALVYERQGRKEESLADLKQASELDPQFAELYRRALDEAGGKPASSPARGWPFPRVEVPLWGVYAAGGLLVLLLLTQTAMALRRETVVQVAPSATPTPRPVLPARGPLVAAPRPDGPEGFEIVRKLGQGGMGEVFEARDLVLGRTVALKRLREEIAGDPRERKRFLKEARAVASLKHPNIVEIHSVVDGPQGLYLVFERVPGEPLHHLLEARGRIGLDQARELARQAGLALDHAHSQGVIHRDLKPSNIMVAEGSVKVMDFGIARLVLETLSTLSRQEAAGTPQYMAPEQERGEARPQSDVYALAVCLYELLAGRPPYPGEGSRERKLRREFVPLCRAVPGLPIGLDGIIARALDPDPAGRYASAGAFAADLARLA